MKLKSLLFISTCVVFSLASGCITDPNEEIRKQAISDEKFITEIEWETPQKQLGTIEEGQRIEVIYKFTNKGSKPLVIKSANASCGCTVPEIPKEPVMPGKSGMLKAVFDSRGRSGENHKTISVTANTKEESHTLDFTVKVNPSPETLKQQEQFQ